MKKLPGELDNNINGSKLPRINNVLDKINDKHIIKLLILTLVIQLLILGSVTSVLVKLNKAYKDHDTINWMEDLDKYEGSETNFNQKEIEETIGQLISKAKDEILVALQVSQVNLVNEENIKKWVSETVDESLSNKLDKDFGEQFEDMTSYFGEKFKETIGNINNKVNNE